MKHFSKSQGPKALGRIIFKAYWCYNVCTCESSFSEPETSFDVSWNRLQEYTFELKVLNIVVFIEFVVLIEFVVSQSPFQRRQWHPTPVLLPGKSHGWRSLEGCSTGGCWGSDTTERLHFHFSLSCIGQGNGNPLQYSCWRIPGMGKPGGLPSLGSHRVGHDWSDLAVAAAESFCLENYWKTDLTRQTESGQFLRSLSMISYLFLKRKFGFSGTGGKIKERIFKWVSEINDKWKMIK